MSEYERELETTVVRVGDAHEIRIDSTTKEGRHRAVCACGWTGKLRHRHESAADDLRDHVADQYRQKARRVGLEREDGEIRGRIRP